MKRISIIIGCLLFLSCNNRKESIVFYNDSLPPITDGYVGLQNGHFVLDGEDWFPKMLNYKAFIDGDRVIPAPYYNGTDLREHFDTIASWGFNAVRVCLDVMGEGDSTAMFEATRRMVQTVDSAGLKVMLLIKTPFEPYWQSYTKGLLRHLADLPALWAFDFMNEPLYFDPKPERDKMDAVRLAGEWRHWVRTYAPHQLFTIATAEPIEVFEWDPSMLPVDFIEMHTYHPLRAASEMWWYANYCGHPWMVGETGLPADDDSVPYDEQLRFMLHTYHYARQQNAIGYGWWEFGDNPDGVNFEAQYTGLRDTSGRRKPAAALVSSMPQLCEESIQHRSQPPVNYYNMLAYNNVAATGTIIDMDGHPIEGAVIRGWNEDWSVGMNTFSNGNGSFRLVSNDICTHFEVSAPGFSKVKFDKHLSYPANIQLPNRYHEYQLIPVTGWSNPDGSYLSPLDSLRYQAPNAVEASLGKIRLRKLQTR